MSIDLRDEFGKYTAPELDSCDNEEHCGDRFISAPANCTSMVKEKPNSTRVYDEEGFRRRAACICVKSEQLKNEVLLVTSSSSPDRWVVPGGGVEPEEEPRMTAIREVMEEAGVCGKLGRCLGVFENNKSGNKHRTEVFILEVTEELPEWEDLKTKGRKRKWFTIEDALEHLSLHKPYQLPYLQSLLTCHNEKVT